MYKAIRFFAHNGEILQKGQELKNATEREITDYLAKGLIDQVDVKIEAKALAAPKNKALKTEVKNK